MKSVLLLVMISITVNFNIILAETIDAKDLIFVILSQNDSYHVKKSQQLENDLINQTNNNSVVYLSYRDFNHPGDWTVFPVITLLWNKHGGHCSWVFFCTQDTKVNVPNLLQAINEQSSDVNFLGRGLSDKEPTIIHHFASVSNFKYLLFASGFAISNKLLQSLAEKVNDGNALSSIDFSIDASHELALFIRDQIKGPPLTHSSKFCVTYSEDCATYIATNYKCGNAINLNEIFFAVKTYHKFHVDRLPVVKETWGKRAKNIVYYSDKLDENIPTVRLNVPNTNYGHCVKTRAILDDIFNQMKGNKNLKWAVITDDDTILSVYRVQDLVNCYNYKMPFSIGERYGYIINSPTGYNYITGGGGVVLSRAAIIKFSRKSKCDCPSNSVPDDMFLFGACLNKLNITLVHVPLFHQARPNDYSDDYLSIGEPISFHKHWMIDPIQVYNDWFEDADNLHSENIHVEL